MNSCVLIAEIIQEPELRYTADNQLEITQMLVQFGGLRENDPPANLKVVGWGNLAKEIQQNYHIGDRVILIGRLSMNTIERPEGFKEKRAEMTVQQIQHLGTGFEMNFSGDNSASSEFPINGMQTQPTPAIPITTPQPSPVATTTIPKNKVNTPPPQSIQQPAPQTTNYEPSSYSAKVQEEIPEDEIPF
ncbi:MAG: single-stranded DNA-binding protein [Nostocales cyanobacterium 94392]|nr:single-stranded DNA-binding protein [Nostocales cyanobacterium 94392]